MTGAPVRSSSATAEATERDLRSSVPSATTTGLKPPDGFFLFLARRFDKIVGNLAPRIRRGGAGVALEAGLVAAQSAFNLVGRLLEAKVGFVRSALGVQAQSRAQTQGAVRTIAGAFARHHHVAADRAAEVAGDRRLDFFQDVLTQSFPDVEVLTRYPQGHRTLALPFRRRGHRPAAPSRRPPRVPARPFRFASIGSPPAESQLGLGACPAHVNRRDKSFILILKLLLCFDRKGIVVAERGRRRRHLYLAPFDRRRDSAGCRDI